MALSAALCMALSIPLATVITFLRLYTRKFIVKKVDASDYVCLLAWASVVAYAVVVGSIGLEHYGGTHTSSINDAQRRDFLYHANVAELVYTPAIIFTRMSLILLYVNMFVARTAPVHRCCLCRGKNTWRWTARAVICLMVAYYVAITIVKIAECLPRSKIWDVRVPGRCVNISAVIVTSGAINFLIDVLVWIFLLWHVWQLRLSGGKKAGLGLLFLFGLVAPATTAARLGLTIETMHNPDTSFVLYQAMLCTVFEVTVGLVCGCLPILPRLWKHFAPVIIDFICFGRRPSHARHRRTPAGYIFERNGTGAIRRHHSGSQALLRAHGSFSEYDDATSDLEADRRMNMNGAAIDPAPAPQGAEGLSILEPAYLR